MIDDYPKIYFQKKIVIFDIDTNRMSVSDCFLPTTNAYEIEN